MAKEFKNWDKVFSRKEITACREKYLYRIIRGIEHNVERIDKWVGGYAQPDSTAVRQAVYLAADAPKWQLFRVSMKGLTTEAKIFMLEQWLSQNSTSKPDTSRSIREIDRIRVNNYIGALRRGGQLNANLEVVK